MLGPSAALASPLHEWDASRPCRATSLLAPLCSAHLAPHGVFLYTVLMTRSSRLTLIRFHKTSPAVSPGSVITSSFWFTET